MQPECLENVSENPKHKREVCQYWLKHKCLKGQACEFLHMIDYDKMPFCALGDSCPSKVLNINNCMYKHLDSNRPLCANYQLGFCSFGRRCKHLHVLNKEVPPEISAYWTPSYAAIEYMKISAVKGFRKKPCEYYSLNKWCPYFDMCNFSHAS